MSLAKKEFRNPNTNILQNKNPHAQINCPGRTKVIMVVHVNQWIIRSDGSSFFQHWLQLLWSEDDWENSIFQPVILYAEKTLQVSYQGEIDCLLFERRCAWELAVRGSWQGYLHTEFTYGNLNQSGHWIWICHPPQCHIEFPAEYRQHWVAPADRSTPKESRKFYAILISNPKIETGEIHTVQSCETLDLRATKSARDRYKLIAIDTMVVGKAANHL